MVSINIIAPNTDAIVEDLKCANEYSIHPIKNSTSNMVLAIAEVSESDISFLKLKYGNRNVWPR